jgi:hypothetical protein
LALVTQALGGHVFWHGATQTVTIMKDSATFSLTIGVALPNNMGTPVIVNNRTYVPLAYVAEMLGAVTRWDGERQAVYIVQ